MNFIMYGIGDKARFFLSHCGLYDRSDIVAIVDGDESKWGECVYGYIIENPSVIRIKQFDKIMVCPENNTEINQILMDDFEIAEEKIISLDDYYDVLVWKIKKRYENNPETKDIINYILRKGMQDYGMYEKKNATPYPVFRDDDGYPYILFYEKRMYFPKTYPVFEIDGREYISDILYEQGEKSPHLYVRNEDETLMDNAVIVDGGVCEGNFALRYIDRCKKAYLIESDPVWINVLKKTFMPYREKVVVCEKLLGSTNDRKHVSLDVLVNERLDFLKLDIEGYEIDALLGGKSILSKNDCHMAICSYHRQNEEENIRFLLKSLGYMTATSEGYMLFMHDPYFRDTLDLRKGVVYAWKG